MTHLLTQIIRHFFFRTDNNVDGMWDAANYPPSNKFFHSCFSISFFCFGMYVGEGLKELKGGEWGRRGRQLMPIRPRTMDVTVWRQYIDQNPRVERTEGCRIVVSLYTRISKFLTSLMDETDGRKKNKIKSEGRKMEET